MVKQRTLD